MANLLFDLFKHLMIERPAAKRSYAQLAAALERSNAKLQARLATAPDTPRNRTQLRHMVGIERWGQRRLRTALGEPLVMDEMDGYVPPENTPVPDLVAALAAARAETVVLARQLDARSIPLDTSVPHNQFGPITARGWLVYLNAHANREVNLVRR